MFPPADDQDKDGFKIQNIGPTFSSLGVVSCDLFKHHGESEKNGSKILKNIANLANVPEFKWCNGLKYFRVFFFFRLIKLSQRLI